MDGFSTDTWLVIIVVLLILVFVLAFLAIRQSFVMVSPENCPTVSGQYGVTPDTTGVTLQTCGNNADSECKFQADTLAEAVESCNSRTDICSVFSFDCKSNIVLFIDPNQSFTESKGTDLYTRQTSATLTGDEIAVLPTT